MSHQDLEEISSMIDKLQEQRKTLTDQNGRSELDDSIVKLTEQYKSITGQDYQSKSYKQLF
tara:strand:+ start:227 stop:409 length:183 start_codon:yes stop_codon:yes gene_type:complete